MATASETTLKEKLSALGCTFDWYWSNDRHFAQLSKLMRATENPLGYTGRGKLQTSKRKTQADVNREVKTWAELSLFGKSKDAIEAEKSIRSSDIGQLIWQDESFWCALLTDARLIIMQHELVGFKEVYNFLEVKFTQITQVQKLGVLTKSLEVFWSNYTRLELNFASGTERDLFATNLESLRTGHYSRKDLDEDSRKRQIPGDIREAVWERDGGRCVMCGSTQDLEFDHIIPFSRGGAHSLNNLRILCRNCNRTKSSHIGR